MAKRSHGGISDQTKASKHRLEDAREILEKAKRWRAAMYIGGYSIECLLKARLMKQFRCNTLDQLERQLHRQKNVRQRITVFTHSLELLLKLTGGFERLRANDKMWPQFARVNDWMPAWRYSPDLGSRSDAKDFLDSVEQLHHWIDVNT